MPLAEHTMQLGETIHIAKGNRPITQWKSATCTLNKEHFSAVQNRSLSLGTLVPNSRN